MTAPAASFRSSLLRGESVVALGGRGRMGREIKGHPGQEGRIALLARQGGFHVGGGLVKQRQKSFVTLLRGV